MNNKLIVIVLVAVFFGLGGGVVGQIVSRVYLMDNSFKVPFVGDIDIKDANMDGKNLVISNAKKVVVEQNEKVAEVANSVGGGVVGIFKKIATSTPSKTVIGKDDFNLNNYYKDNDILGQGFIITSDGWVMSNFLPKELADKKFATSSLKNLFQDYVIITKDKKIFTITNIVFDKSLNYSFWKVEAKDLPVRVFASNKDVTNGQLLMAVNWNESVWVSTILSKTPMTNKLILSSDDYSRKLVMASGPNPVFFGSFLFDLSGNLVAFINNDGSVGFIGNYVSCINCLLEKGLIKKASLGVNYIDLSSLVKSVSDKYPENGALITADEKGVAIKKSSSAEVAKLKNGDIIISVNGIEINKNNQLSDLIGSFKPGEMMDVVYLRNDKKENVSVVLGELN